MADVKAAAERARKAQEAAEIKEAEAERRRAAAGPPKPPKYTKKLISMQEKKSLKRARQNEEAGASGPAETRRVLKVDGTDLNFNKAIFDIVDFLKKREHLAEATFDEVRNAKGIDLQRNAELLNELRSNNKRVEVYDNGGGLRIRYAPPHGVRNMGDLVHLVEHCTPSRTDGGPETVMRSELLKDTYPGVEEHIEALAKDPSNRFSMLACRNTFNREDAILFATPEIQPASDLVRGMWRESKPPKDEREMQLQLIQRKVVTKQELDEREARKAAVRKAAKDLEDANKKSRAPTFRKVTNNHLAMPPK